MSKLSIFRELWDFLNTRKKWWLLPILAMFLLLGALLFFAQSSTMAPFIYALF